MSKVFTHAADPALPGLSIALDLESLFGLMSERLPECRDGLEFLDGRVMDVQYRPGAGAHVLWKVRVHDQATGRSGRQLVFVRVLRDGEAIPAEPATLIAQYAELRKSTAMRHEMPLRTPWLPIADAGLIVHAFPLDPALPSLMTVGSAAAMKVALDRVWRARNAKVRRVRVSTLSYTPGARAAMQYEVLAEDRDTLLPELRRLVGKLDVQRSPARLFAGHWSVWRRTFGKVSIAPPVGYVAVARLSLQEFLTGTRLSDLAGEGEFIGRVRQAARGIAHIHSLRLPLLKHRGLEKEMASVERWTGVLSGLRPAQATRLARLSSRLRTEMSERMRVTATIHADFHLANILTDEHGVTLIDWDQVAHGDPMLDTGRFLASLRVSSLRINGTLDGLAPIEDAFLEVYLEHSNDNEQRARLFEAASLLTAAAAPFRLQREGWEDHADVMIDEVEHMLELSLAGPRFTGTHADLKRQIDFAERAEWATDRVYAQAQLVPIIHETIGPDIEVTECHPRLKENTRSRIYVRWILKGYRGSMRWRLPVEAVGFPETSGRSKFHRLENAHLAAVEDPSALQVVRPLGLVTPLSLLVFEPASGKRFDKILESSGRKEALEQIARALGRFHSLEVPLTRERSTKRIIRSVLRRARALRRADHPDARAVRQLLGSITQVLEERGERRAPCVFPLVPRQLWMSADRITVSPAHDVLYADPLMNAGSFLAQLSLTAALRGSGDDEIERFRAAYLEASGEPDHDLAAWESLFILRLACVRGIREPSASLLLPTTNTARL